MQLNRFCLGVGLVSAASLSMSLLFTRIFSVTMYYHFAFLLVSLALLGIAVAGVAIYLLPKTFTDERLAWQSGLFALLMAPLGLAALSTAVSNPLSVDLSSENTTKLLKLYFSTALPFFASGFAISLAISAAKEHIGRVYAFDLIGAALGCIAIVPLVPELGGQASIVVVCGMAALGGGVLALSSKATSGMRSIVGFGGVATAIVLSGYALFGNPGTQAFALAKNPSKFLGACDVEFEKWNSFSRVTVCPGDTDHKWLGIDADAATRMYSGEIAKDGYVAPKRFSETLVAGLVYALKKEGPSVIIGPGGGPDVISALRNGVPRIIGVEVNPIIADSIMRGAYVKWNGDLYRQPSINVVVDDGRSFIRRAPEQFASIQATLVDTWAASAAGAFTLSENNLYTADAFEDYLGHLKPNGVLSMTRWAGDEFIRLLGLGREALRRRGVPEAEQPSHFYIGADNRMSTMLLKPTPFTAEEIAILDAEIAASQLNTLYSATRPQGPWPELNRFMSMSADEYFSARYNDPQNPMDLRPVTDARPFFFYNVRGGDFVSLLFNLGQLDQRADKRNNLGLVILQIVLLVSTALTLLLVVLPLFIFRREALASQRAEKLKVLGYFLCLGMGFILVELGLMQRFILFLGHPVYALAVVLATLLGSSGVGSALSPRLLEKFGLHGAVRRTIIALGALLLIYAVGLGPLFGVLLGLPLAARIIACVVLVGALGTLMGICLPLGVRAAVSLGADMVPWGWGLNGATSVVGSTLSLIISMHFGFTATLLCGLGAYVVGALLLGRPGTASPNSANEAKAALPTAA